MKMSKLSRGVAVVVALASLAVKVQAQTPLSPADRDAAARSAYARGDTTRASAALNEAVRLNPFDPVALNNLAVNYAAQGDYQNAVALLERAQRLAPNRSDIVNNLANLKAWMAQDSQFAVGSRGVPQALNFPRAEDTPPELPPLWAPPAPAPVSQAQMRSAATANTYPPAQSAPGYAQPQPPAPVYPQQGYAQQQPIYQQQPAYQQPSYPAQGQGGYPVANQAPAAYSRAPAITERTDYAARVTASPSRQNMITERASDALPRKKKKRQVLDCPVP